MSTDKHAGISGVETAASHSSYDSPPHLTKRQKVKNHCKKWWWVHLIIFIVVTLALVLGLVYGIVPHLSQKAINDSTLEVSVIEITDTYNTNFTFGINSTIHGHVPVKSHLGEQQLAMYLIYPNGTEGVPFMYLNISKLDLEDTIPLNIMDYPMQVADMDAYIDFTTAALAGVNVTLGVSSKPTVHVGSLKNKVTYKKTVTIAGFNGLKDVRLSNLRFLENQTDGATMEADVSIPNDSQFILQVGDLNMGFNGTIGGREVYIGYGIVHDLTLQRGNNSAKVRTFSTLSPTLIQFGLGDPSATLKLYGNSTTRNGEHIRWLEIPLSSTTLVVPPPNIVTSNSTSE